MYFPLAGETVPIMVKLSIIVAVLLVVVGYSGAGPAPSPPDGLDTVSRFLRFFAVKQPHSLSRVRRQTARCQNVTDCLPLGVTNTNTNLAECIAGQCVCTDCFTSNNGSRCQICPDYPYDNAQDRCGLDGRPRQLTAFLLSLFLSSTGAANFYIGQNGLCKACL